MNDSTKFKTPPVTKKADNTPRMVGFEMEFSGISLEKSVEALQSSLGGKLKDETKVAKIVHVDSLGDFKIELDWDFLKRQAEDQKTDNGNKDWLDSLSKAASLMVPVEVVCPPVSITELDSLNPMISSFRSFGAVGTEESLLAAYGVHVNTEIESLDAATIYAYLRAFSLLQWWLVKDHDVDISRKISPYIGLYPEKYIKGLLSSSDITLESICSDYLKHNATRNRALDMLPLLAENDEAGIKKIIGDSKVNARPTFHYRLPDCHIEEPMWSLAKPWNSWWLVEELASREEDLDQLSNNFLDAERLLLGVNRNDWVEFIDKWLRNQGLV